METRVVMRMEMRGIEVRESTCGFRQVGVSG